MPGDSNTLLAERRTRLALGRSVLASERTLMAWIRTSLSMISFGFTVVKFFEYVEEERHLTIGWRAWRSETFGLTLITIGTVALVVAVVQHWNTLGALQQEGLDRRWSLVLTVGTLVACLGVFAFGSLVVRY